MRKILLVVLIVMTSNVIEAQFIKEKSINAQIGLGLTIPFNSIDAIADKGFYAQGELVLKVASWVSLRPYAGIVLTSSNGKDLYNNPTDESATSKAFLLGGKARVSAPIPWVSPYLELGIGASIGKFETFTAFDTIDKSGFIYHIPFSFGLAIGRNHNVDVGFTYFFQPTVEQAAGAFAVGLSIPLNPK